MLPTKQLTDNLRDDCCTTAFNAIIPIINRGQTLQVKLYRTIKNGCEQKEEFATWHDLQKIIVLNGKTGRVAGIICHSCKNKDCVLSVKTATKTYRYANSKKIETRVV